MSNMEVEIEWTLFILLLNNIPYGIFIGEIVVSLYLSSAGRIRVKIL